MFQVEEIDFNEFDSELDGELDPDEDIREFRLEDESDEEETDYETNEYFKLTADKPAPCKQREYPAKGGNWSPQKPDASKIRNEPFRPDPPIKWPESMTEYDAFMHFIDPGMINR